MCFDGSLQPGQLDRLSGVAAGAWVRGHGAHDFGSWSVLARELVGWDALAAYDEVLLANDSCWLLRPLDEVFARMDARPGDFWGLQVTARRFEPEPSQPQSVPLDEVKRSWLPPTAFRAAELVHVGSYFLALRRPVLDDRGLPAPCSTASSPSATAPTWCRSTRPARRSTSSARATTGTRGCPSCDPTIRSTVPAPSTLLAEGFPLFKRRFLVDNPYDTPDLADWQERVLAAVPDAPVAQLEAHLRRVADPDALARSLAAGPSPARPLSSVRWRGWR